MIYYSIGFLPSHHFTIVYSARDNVALEYKLIENNEFLFKITEILDYFLLKYFQKNEISFLSFYTGPAPLVTSRTVAAFIQGWSTSKNIKVVTLSSLKIWNKDPEVPVFINLFGGKYLFVTNTEEKIITQNEFEEKIKEFKCISITKGVKIPLEYFEKNSAYTLIIPNFTFIGNKRFKKFKNLEFTETKKINPDF